MLGKKHTTETTHPQPSRGGLRLGPVMGGFFAGAGALAAMGASAAWLAERLGYGVSIFPTAPELLSALAVAAVCLGLAGLLAGWVSGRMAQRQGGLPGMITGALMCLLGATVVAGIASSDTLLGLGLSTARATALEGGALAVVGGVMTLSLATLGGVLGGRWRQPEEWRSTPAEAAEARDLRPVRVRENTQPDALEQSERPMEPYPSSSERSSERTQR